MNSNHMKNLVTIILVTCVAAWVLKDIAPPLIRTLIIVITLAVVSGLLFTATITMVTTLNKKGERKKMINTDMVGNAPFKQAAKQAGETILEQIQKIEEDLEADYSEIKLIKVEFTFCDKNKESTAAFVVEADNASELIKKCVNKHTLEE